MSEFKLAHAAHLLSFQKKLLFSLEDYSSF